MRNLTYEQSSNAQLDRIYGEGQLQQDFPQRGQSRNQTGLKQLPQRIDEPNG
jgi:hypothetical protein